MWDGKRQCLAQVSVVDLFRFKINIKLSQVEFLSFIASDFKNLFINQIILKPNGSYDFREKRMEFFIRQVEKAHSLTL